MPFPCLIKKYLPATRKAEPARETDKQANVYHVGLFKETILTKNECLIIADFCSVCVIGF